MKVLSTTSSRLCCLAMAATRRMSVIFSVGLVGVSSHTILVFSVIAPSSSPSLLKSTKEKSRL